MSDSRSRIINVLRKPQKCPVCGGRVVDIIYGTGDMKEWEYLLEYRRDGIMGGDNIPKRPPIWACVAGCKRFRKVNWDGSDAEVKVKMLKNVRKKPLTLINYEAEGVKDAIRANRMEDIKHYHVKIETEFAEEETLSITAVSEKEARDLAEKLIEHGGLGLAGCLCKKMEVVEV